MRTEQGELAPGLWAVAESRGQEAPSAPHSAPGPLGAEVEVGEGRPGLPRGSCPPPLTRLRLQALPPAFLGIGYRVDLSSPATAPAVPAPPLWPSWFGRTLQSAQQPTPAVGDWPCRRGGDCTLALPPPPPSPESCGSRSPGDGGGQGSGLGQRAVATELGSAGPRTGME